ncbi:MAG: palindromic element RPE1 domain-containing protein [Rickettsia endosymbiont of Ixodes persulcatus]|nr:palindromic element RPE1 domain-containing protein [Rickettsia endosymbiont of Ixodes persulcatus]MCZ6902731.1 palindromic element RPE1 domain-containing protein [Rickettsia endosymbiont of Ixodes persulcatus]MCZ6909232.1 palindromic element RPE1 domain-containing protein [Rickettsia endosymbiont of Ixodes persulcatus]MCZ6911044.1 palindromic element RPE1 domain-containing protein [Rickettsia endosymbiont of Ixodes persulcatus]MCZ6914939.1 palindromic element RPE1 domain-containing protein [
MNNLLHKEEFEGNTERSTAAYKKVRDGLTYKLPLEGGYSRGLLLS